MYDGFLRVAAATPDIRVADCSFNAASASALIKKAHEQGVSLLVLPELCLTGYTCSDLFLQQTLCRGAEEGLRRLIAASKGQNMVTLAGLVIVMMVMVQQISDLFALTKSLFNL